MNKLRRLAAVLLVAALSLCGAANPAGRPLSCNYYTESDFFQSLQEARSYPVPEKIRAGVIPHHLLAGRLIASFFKTVSQWDYDTVLFVAPQHYPTGSPAVTSSGGWAAPSGTLENDRDLTRIFLENRFLEVQENSANMELDHAVSGLIPYVKHYLPDVEVSALLLDSRYGAERAELLSTVIRQEMERREILLIGSMDFSHYLMPGEAAKKDAETHAAVSALDYPRIARFGDSHVDSPSALAAVLRCAEGLGRNVSFLDHSSSDQILKLPLTDPAFREGTTTYYVLGA